MYDSAARVQEIADIKIKDIRLNTPVVITLHGKGNKTIHVPILGKVRDLLTGYLEDHKKYSWGIALSDIPVFCNQKNQSLTRWEISFILKRYVEMARKDIGFMVNFPVTPHILRHSKAVGMLKSGINLIYIKDFLDHSNVSTTEVYVCANSEMKRKALETAYEKVGLTSFADIPSWGKDPKLKEFLKSLS